MHRRTDKTEEIDEKNETDKTNEIDDIDETDEDRTRT